MENQRQILGPDELADMLGMAASTLKRDAHRKPEKLPPRVKMPGTNRMAWKLATVQAWIAQLEEKGDDHAQA